MGVQYVLTERLCQDSLENYFGQQRAIGRRKDNPSLHDIGYNDNTIRNQCTFKPIIGTNSLDNNPEPKTFTKEKLPRRIWNKK
jgi:hypothetical protein